jgi:hypothetical protein
LGCFRGSYRLIFSLAVPSGSLSLTSFRLERVPSTSSGLFHSVYR